MTSRFLVLALNCASAFATTCESLTDLKLPATRITSAQTVAAGTFTPPAGPPTGPVIVPYKQLPAFCRVQGVLQPSGDSHIEFEVWLPSSAWNGKYQGTGNGGFAGSIGYSGLASAVAAGYATSSTDAGHKAANTDGTWALGHPEKIVDYGYRAIHETSEKSKAITKAFYGESPQHSYFNGCSNGGRQALLEAQRYPADYDGIIAGAPANFLTHHVAGFVWDIQTLEENAPSYIPAKKLKAIEAAALAACDTLDGDKDGLIADPANCHFEPDVLLCRGSESDDCLTQPQVSALKKVYAGPRDSKSEQIFPGYLPGGETGFLGWTAWITGAAPGKSLQYEFGTHFFADLVFQNTNWDYRTFNFDGDVKSADRKAAHIFNATDPNLKAFHNLGGKLILYHGWSDAAIAPLNTVNYYENVVAKMGEKSAGSFLRLYMVPGMQHCAGGPGPNDFGQFGPGASDARNSVSKSLEEWVEKSAAPAEIIATKYKSDFNPSSGVARTRPICPYPQTARYKGTGSLDEAANFACTDTKKK